MQLTSGSERSRARRWTALAGAMIIGALAVGMLQTGANASPSVSASGYGSPTGNGKAPCQKSTGGYHTVPCPSDVSSVSTSPARPAAGKGFKVSFKSKSGGAYAVTATRNGKKTALESGATGTGKTTTKKVGKGLKAGKYQLKVTMDSGNKSDSAKETLKIRK
jgi:hypothetical protein